MKKKIRLLLILLLSIILVFVITLFNNKQNVNTIYPSVVNLKCKNDKTTTTGSGIVYNIKEGKQYIVTNYHIVRGYSKIYVHDSDFNKEQATIINYDEDKDIAIVSVKNNLNTKKAVFDENSKIKKGDKVYVLTSFIGKDKTNIVKDALIASVNHKVVLGDETINSVKLSYEIENGDSGSPVINKKGKVVAMIFLKDTDIIHYGYALPINFILEQIKKLESKKSKINIGAMMTNSTNVELLEEYNLEIKKIKGVVILSLIDNYPLYNSGLQKGDVITKFNNVEISNISILKDEINKLRKNDEVNIEYYRNNNLIKGIIKLNR